jgi:hypothetical protein
MSPLTTGYPRLLPDTTLPKRKLSIPYTLMMASGEILPILKTPFMEMTLGQNPIHIWTFVPEITYKFIPVLDILCTYDVFMHFRSNVLWLGQEEVIC